MTNATTPDWRELEARPEFREAERLAREQIIPLLPDFEPAQQANDGMPKELRWPVTGAFTLFFGLMASTHFLLPSSFLFEMLRFFLFPLMFFGSLLATIFIFKDRFIGAFLRGQERFIARSKALAAVAGAIGLDYTPVPGGAPKALRAFANWRFAPDELKEIASIYDAHGGLEEPVAIARRSGLFCANASFVADKTTQVAFAENHADAQQFEDGFSGVRNGRRFDAFEWAESDGDGATVHHLVLVLAAPTRLHGVTPIAHSRRHLAE